MMKEHKYQATIKWTGNKGSGTSGYREYRRDHLIQSPEKRVIEASSDPSFRGDPGRYNPEELLVASLSSCHMLWVLHLCSAEGVIVTDYVDAAEGTMAESEDGSGHFTEVVLKPKITVTAESMIPKLEAIHHKANKMCFIANSFNFPVRHEGRVKVSILPENQTR